MHNSSLLNMNAFVNNHLSSLTSKPLKILDIGSQDINGSYKSLFNNPNWEYSGLDMAEGKNVDIVLKDIYNWKEIKSESFDVVISGQAVEHIEYVWLTMLEIARVLKHGGICCIIAPSAGHEHRYPKDCWRMFPDGLKALAKYAKLEEVQSYNCWNLRGVSPAENEWKDTVLVAKKKENPSFSEIFSFKLKYLLSKIVYNL